MAGDGKSFGKKNALLTLSECVVPSSKFWSGLIYFGYANQEVRACRTEFGNDGCWCGGLAWHRSVCSVCALIACNMITGWLEIVGY